MMSTELREPLVLLAEQRRDGWHVSACDANGQLSTRRMCGPGRWQSQLDEWLRAFEPAAVSAVALLLSNCESREYPTAETLLPCPVLSFPRRLALAAFAPAAWPRFAVVDADIGCGLVTRSEAHRFYYSESVASDSARLAREFGYARAVAGRDSLAGFEQLERVSGDRLREGAARLAIAALRSDGVCRDDTPGCPTLRLGRRRSAGYEILHIRGTFDPENDCLARVVNGRSAFFAVDGAVWKLYGLAMRKYARSRLPHCTFATVCAGDALKSWPQVAYLCEQAERACLPRDGIIVGVGGGVTLDLAGLAASLYHRGAPYVRVPTTLLGMVDVAVGIKHAINFNGRKSLLGAFYPPERAINDFELLKTLPKSELANGFSEIIKLGLVRDHRLFDWVERHGAALVQSRYQHPPDWAERIALRAEYVMMADLQPNLYEEDRRRYPDFGHTFSPAIEEATEYALPHGAAVAVDMLLTTIISVERGICEEEVLGRLVAIYESLGLLTMPESCNVEVLARALQSARLHRSGQIHMVVPKAVGAGCFLEDITVEEAQCAFERAAVICAPPRRSHARAGD